MSNITDQFNIFTELTKNKIIEIKDLMNKYVSDKIINYKKKHDCPIYLSYILDQLMTSFPIIKIEQNTDQIILQINLIDQFHIHPYIFQTLFINMIQSIYIDKIIKNKNNSDKTFIDDIIRINPEVTLIFEQFNSIFDSIDTKYLPRENDIGHNNMTILDYDEFNTLFNRIAIVPQNQSNIGLKELLNIFIIQLQRITQINMENSIQTIKIDLDEIIEHKHIILFELNINCIDTIDKITFDYNLLQHIIQLYTNLIRQNYLQIKFFDIFENINISDKLIELNNSAVYYWIDYIAIINNSLFEKLLKE